MYEELQGSKLWVRILLVLALFFMLTLIGISKRMYIWRMYSFGCWNDGGRKMEVSTFERQRNEKAHPNVSHRRNLYVSCPKRSLLAARVPEEEGVVDDVSEDDIGMNDEILQEMTLEKFEHVSDF
jgi:hypothetical protein